MPFGGPFDVAEDGTARVWLLIIRRDLVGERKVIATSTTALFSNIRGRLLVASGLLRLPPSLGEADHDLRGRRGAARISSRTEAIEGSDVEVVFDAPTKDWAARRNAPTVNLYLYDIREDLRRRERGWSDQRGDGRRGRVTASGAAVLQALLPGHRLDPAARGRAPAARRPAPRFLLYDALPGRLVTGPLAETGSTYPITVGLPPPEDRAFADVWSALGGELKPSLDLVVVAPIDTGVVYPAGPAGQRRRAPDATDLVDGGPRSRPAPPHRRREPVGRGDVAPSRSRGGVAAAHEESDADGPAASRTCSAGSA